MLRNYFIVALRNVLKNKVFSAINVLGLGIGLASCLLIFQFVSFELSYDTFNERFDRTYRVTNDRFQNGKLIQHGTIMYPTIGPTMAKDYPEIESYTRMMPAGEINIKAEDRIFKGDNCHFADEHFFTVFSYPLLAGDRTTALKEPYTLVITERTAIKYFQLSDRNFSSVLGKSLYWGTDKTPWRVTGVCADIPENSHLQFDALASYVTLHAGEDKDADNSWQWSDMRHYLVLKPGADYKALEAKFPEFSDRYFQGDKVSGSVEKFYLQPLREAHLYSNYEYDVAKVASGKAVWAMLVVAIFILAIAWINYVNLSTSRALERAKEVGLRKVMGAVKTQLIGQFVLESILISLIALVAAVGGVLLVQPWFNRIVGSQLSWGVVWNNMTPVSFIAFVAVMLAGILLSGFYPAFVLSSYQPVTVLKGKFQRSSGGQLLRKFLVIFQFTASAALITGTLVVSDQINFMNEADLGINLHNTIVFDGPERTEWDSTFIQRVESYKHEISQLPGVLGVTTSGRLPGDRLGRTFSVRLSDQPSDAKYTLSVQNVDYGYFDTYQIKVLAGRAFRQADHKVKWMDLNTVVLNSSAVKLLGLPDDASAVGKEIIWGSNDRRWTIVGVVSDFHQESLRNPMEAMVFRPTYGTYAPATVRVDHLDEEQSKKLISQVEQVFKTSFPDNGFSWLYLEDRYKQQYKDDNRFGNIIRTFTALAIIISCLGLAGLSAYMTVQRTKEIGIRKTLGASVPGLVTLLSRDFLLLVGVAIVCSIPVAWYGLDNWLSGYAYRIHPGVISFLLPSMIVLGIAVFTVSFQVVRTAMSNPVDTLRYE